MTASIPTYFDDLERVILESDSVLAYVVLRREITSTDGKLRIRARLKDGGLLEFFEYVTLGLDRQIARLRYSCHWQDAQGQLLQRWDNVAHYPDLPNAPHHVHLSDGDVAGIAGPPDLAAVIARIEAYSRGGGLI